jgi:hypothetical protein
MLYTVLPGSGPILVRGTIAANLMPPVFSAGGGTGTGGEQ